MKKISKVVSIILCLSVVFSTFVYISVCANAADNIIGDANSDGAVNSFDALMIIRYCTGEETLKSNEIKAADVDGNGTINATDALYVLHYSIGKITTFPASGNVSSDRIYIAGGFWYDPATGKVTNEYGSGLLGFSYDASEKVFYASNNAWQRSFGYTYLYDVAAPFGICWYDTTRIYFNYNNKEWMIQLWKGQYGWVLIGCEIGLYYRDSDDKTLVDTEGRKFYKCADDDMLIKMSLSLYKNNSLLFSRKQQYSWWLTGFVPGKLDGFGITPEATQALTIDSKLTFKDEDMMDAFISGLNNVTTIQHNASKKERAFKFEYGKNYSVNRAECSVSLTWN
jgi:hypothetical protein